MSVRNGAGTSGGLGSIVAERSISGMRRILPALPLLALLAVPRHRRARAVAPEARNHDGVVAGPARDARVAGADDRRDHVVARAGVDARAGARRDADRVVAVAAEDRIRDAVALDVVV